MTPAGGPKEHRPRGDSRRQAILDAAWTVFLDKGFERTRLGDIIALSGGSRATLYETFGDKDGLFETAITMKCAEFVERLRRTSFSNRDPEQDLNEIGLNFARGVLSADGSKTMRLLVANGDQFPRVVDAFITGGPQAIRRILSDYLRRATRKGQLHVTEPDHAAAAFLSLLHGDQYLRMLLHPTEVATSEELKRHVEGAVKIFLDGVR